ncbi:MULTISPECIES: LysR family transcriptional regulator [Gordonia]|uniref:Putative LysR family transcriptional regulator n=1 Tax=Gordonia sihwensis NBRC 108236 TaxID=1223544 RepID=L7LMV3_9ACTN|nr:MULTISPECIES: LysR substrate-binding domain-containing protein [Gordonia]AUH67254.1 LysR family transcriptional regulator [Gordonia sp. YC-JH1]GAC62056.1 putative LysR family transcriptional regulator [Gordonia sihwensis NBRC 108236]
MELRHLRYFAAVADTCHFGRAADRLHIAQPALSYAIRQLEAELGVSLFARTTRQVTLTAAGEFLKGEVDRILVGIDAAVDGVQRVAAGRSGVVRLGLTGIAVFSHLPRIARAVRSELPHVELRIVSDLLTPDQCDRLRDGAIDLGVLRPPVVGEGIEVRTIDVEPLVLAVASDHRLAVEPVVSVDDLRSESFVMYDSRDSAVNEAAVRTCRTAGFVPHRAHDASGTPVLLALVAAGLGVALLPASVRALPLENVVVRDLPDTGTMPVALARRAGDDNPVVDAVAAVAAAAFASASARALDSSMGEIR